MIKNLSSKKKYFISIVVAVAVPIIFLAGVTYPVFYKTAEFSDQYIGLKKDLKLLEMKRDSAEKFKEEIKINEDKFKKVEQSFLNENNLVEFIESIEGFAQKSGVEIDFEKISDPQKEKNVSYILLQLSVNGAYSNFVKFLRILENFRQYSVIESLQIQKKSSQEDPLEDRERNIKADLNLKTYLKGD